MAQGLQGGKVIDDLSVTERKLSDEVIQELNSGAGTIDIDSSRVGDVNSRPGYSKNGVSVKDDFDGISAKLKSQQDTVDDMKDRCPCDGGYSLTVTPNTYNFGDIIVGQSGNLLVTVVGKNLRTPITYPVPDGYSITPQPGWNDLTGGTLSISFNPEEVGLNTAPILFQSKAPVGDNIFASAYLVVSGDGVPVAALTATPDSHIFTTVGEHHTVQVTGIRLSNDITYELSDELVPFIEVSLNQGWNNRTGGSMDLHAVTLPNYQVIGTVTLRSGDIETIIEVGLPGQNVIQFTPDNNINVYPFGSITVGQTSSLAFTAFLSEEAAEVGSRIFVKLPEGGDLESFLIEEVGHTSQIYTATVEFRPQSIGFKQLAVTVIAGRSIDDPYAYTVPYYFTGTGI